MSKDVTQPSGRGGFYITRAIIFILNPLVLAFISTVFATTASVLFLGTYYVSEAQPLLVPTGGIIPSLADFRTDLDRLAYLYMFVSIAWMVHILSTAFWDGRSGKKIAGCDYTEECKADTYVKFKGTSTPMGHTVVEWVRLAVAIVAVALAINGMVYVYKERLEAGYENIAITTGWFRMSKDLAQVASILSFAAFSVAIAQFFVSNKNVNSFVPLMLRSRWQFTAKELAKYGFVIEPCDTAACKPLIKKKDGVEEKKAGDDEGDAEAEEGGDEEGGDAEEGDDGEKDTETSAVSIRIGDSLSHAERRKIKEIKEQRLRRFVPEGYV